MLWNNIVSLTDEHCANCPDIDKKSEKNVVHLHLREYAPTTTNSVLCRATPCMIGYITNYAAIRETTIYSIPWSLLACDDLEIV